MWLQEILLDDQITKLGVNIGGDVLKLGSDYGVQVCGAIVKGRTLAGESCLSDKRGIHAESVALSLPVESLWVTQRLRLQGPLALSKGYSSCARGGEV